MPKFDDDAGTRLTVYVQPMEINGKEFHYLRQGDDNMVLWAEPCLAVAVIGRVSAETIATE